MNPRAKIGLILGFCISLGLHGVAYASLAHSRPEPPPRDFVSEVSIEVKAPPPALVPATLAPATEPVASPTRAPSTSSKQLATLVAAPASAPSTPAPAAALDLSGVTLTNDTGAGFAMPVGDGSALHGPIGAGRQSVEPAAGALVAAPAAQRPALVPVSDLSEHPVPPALASVLRANYPEQARQRGLRGSASVRARIDPDGVVRAGRLVSESAAGFGAACRRTVLGSHWSPPRDKNGGAVATEIVYTCHFEVEQ
jgi:TonB family protein